MRLRSVLMPMFLSCQCQRASCRHDAFHVHSMGEDGDGADIEVWSCTRCGQNWLHYLLEWPHLPRSGPWWRVKIADDALIGLGVEQVKGYVEQQSWSLVGGSFHSQGARRLSAPLRVA